MSFNQSDPVAANRRMHFRLSDPNGKALTGFTPTAIIVIQNGAYVAGAGVWQQIDSTHAPGWYYYQFTQSELGVLGRLGIEITGAVGTLANGFAIDGDQVV